jgi:hypothetical protein
MKPTALVAACVAAAATSLIGFAPESFGNNNTTREDVSPGLAVFTRQGIPIAQARRAFQLQQRVAATHLISRIEDTLGAAFAGVWFEPAAARFHIGVSLDSSRDAAERVVRETGMAASVTYTPVRSRWAALVDVVSELGTRLAPLAAAGDATAGIDVPHNAVAVTLSSSVADVDRIAREIQATPWAVNVAVKVAPPAQFREQPAAVCENPFTRERARCETTLVAGVGIVTPRLNCTAGPMLIEGNETYMLTAGHCLNITSIGAAGQIFNNLLVTGEYPTIARALEIGREGKRYNNRERDVAEIKINRTVAPVSLFLQALPTPLPALVTEWARSPRTPHAVEGMETPAVNQSICHEGWKSGEQCGLIVEVDVESAGVEHLVRTEACGQPGDSGGPFFFTSLRREVLMEGTLVGVTTPEVICPAIGRSSFEPLADISGRRLGILASFAPAQLLTTRNERRPVGGGKSTSALLLSGESFPVTIESLPKEPNEIKSEVQNAAGQLTSSGFFMKGEIKSATEGEYEALYLRVTLKATEAKCNTAGDKEGEVLVPKGKFKLVHDAGPEAGNGILLEVGEFAVECGAVKIKLHGSLLGLLKPASEMVTKGEVELHCSSTQGVPAEKSYWLSLLASELTAKLEANFGTGFKEACEELNPEKTVELDFGKMVELMQ